MLREKDVESYLRDRVKKAGGKAYKFVSPGNDGMPDRMVCFPWSRIVFFVETKTPGKEPTPRQRARHRELRKMGQSVFGKIDSKEDVDLFMDIAAGHILVTKKMVQDLEMDNVGI